jgi:hypothetical protein
MQIVDQREDALGRRLDVAHALDAERVRLGGRIGQDPGDRDQQNDDDNAEDFEHRQVHGLGRA